MTKLKHTHNGEVVLHYDHPLNDYSLCGMAMEGDDPWGDGSDSWDAMFPTEKGKVNCENCLKIVAHIKGKK